MLHKQSAMAADAATQLSCGRTVFLQEQSRSYLDPCCSGGGFDRCVRSRLSEEHSRPPRTMFQSWQPLRAKNLMRNVSLAVAAVLAVALPGCSVTSPIWKDSNRAGPPLASGAPTREMHRCTMAQIQLFPGSNGHCYESFAAADGTRVGFGELYTEIAYTFNLAPQLGPPFDGSSVPTPQTYYRLHLVALSPTVIVGVPLDRYDSRWEEQPGGRACIYIKARRATAGHDDWRGREWRVHYNVPVPARQGSFVYAPGLKRAAQPLPDQPTATVDLGGGRTLQLRQVGGNWEVLPGR